MQIVERLLFVAGDDYTAISRLRPGTKNETNSAIRR